jgi:hypothetical protein
VQTVFEKLTTATLRERIAEKMREAILNRCTDGNPADLAVAVI